MLLSIANALPATRRTRGCIRRPCHSHRRRADHGARRGPGGRALHRPERRPRHRDHRLRRRDPRRHQPRTARVGADPDPRLGPRRRRDGLGPASPARRSTAPTPPASRATSARSRPASASTAAPSASPRRSSGSSPRPCWRRPSASSRRRARRVVGSHSLAGPLTLSGVSPAVATMFARASRKAGHPLVTSVASGGVGYPPQPLVPGAAVSVGLTSGDVGIGSIGTVAYADGGDVWLFGHSLDGAGRRSLFLEDAYIQTVINNPVGAPELSTYKLGSPGNDVGTVTNDTIDAVAGRLGALPPHYPLRVTARDLDTGQLRSVNTLVADEGDVGDPAGPSLLGLAGAAAVADAAATVLGGAPARQSGEMCVAITLRELQRPGALLPALRGRRLRPQPPRGHARRRHRGRRGDHRRLRVRGPASDERRGRPAPEPRPAPGLPAGRDRPASRAPRDARSSCASSCGARAPACASRARSALRIPRGAAAGVAHDQARRAPTPTPARTPATRSSRRSSRRAAAARPSSRRRTTSRGSATRSRTSSATTASRRRSAGARSRPTAIPRCASAATRASP